MKGIYGSNRWGNSEIPCLILLGRDDFEKACKIRCAVRCGKREQTAPKGWRNEKMAISADHGGVERCIWENRKRK